LTSETRILAHRLNAQNPRQKAQRSSADCPDFTDSEGSNLRKSAKSADLLFLVHLGAQRALCVSGVKIRAKQSQFRGSVSQEPGTCRANQSQFARGRVNAKSRLGRGLRENRRMTPLQKQSQSSRVCRTGHKDLPCKTKPISGRTGPNHPSSIVHNQSL
jgi:hypothetical protein